MYKYLFSRIYDPFMRSFEKVELFRRRRRLLRDLEGTVLEIGSGTGANFPFYRNGVAVFAVEPNVHMWDIINKKIMQNKYDCRIIPIVSGIEDQKTEEKISDSSLDAAVCTLVLCNVPDAEQTLNFIFKKLKKGGKLILLEHIRSHHPLTAKMQDFAAPVWKILADGCCLNRATDMIPEKIGFSKKEESYFSTVLPFYQAVWEK